MNTINRIFYIFALILTIGLSISGASAAGTDEYPVLIGNASDIRLLCPNDTCKEYFGTTICNLDAPSMYGIITSGKNTTIVIIDVRTEEEYQESHIQGAKNIYYSDPDFTSKLESLNKTDPVVVYCTTAIPSGYVLPIMQELGFSTILNLKYGINEWIQDGYPVST